MNLIRLCCFLLFTQIYSQDIRINELVASNSIFQDEDGDTPDWIELYNYGSSPVSLINWSISDEEDDTNPWVFPEIILNEDEYMLLWASNKNRGQLTYPRTLITEGDLFKYITPTSSVSSNWTSVNYNDNSWSEGSSGFGYSDSDDNTNIPSGTLSVFIRKDFTILDINNIVSLILDIDYDDGFVAYINGFEVARANINGSPPAYNATTNTDHEAQIYVGGYPERFVIDNFQNILIEGTNTLSIQAHNVSDTSSDFTLIPFLTGEKDASEARQYSFCERVKPDKKGTRKITAKTEGAFMVRSDDFKLIMYPDGDSFFYDLKNDPDESYNIVNDLSYKMQILELEKALENWLKETNWKGKKVNYKYLLKV